MFKLSERLDGFDVMRLERAINYLLQRMGDGDAQMPYSDAGGGTWPGESVNWANLNLPFRARLTTFDVLTGLYGWEAEVPTSPSQSGWSPNDGMFTGTTTASPAFEANDNTAAVGTVVNMRRAYFDPPTTAGGNGFDWIYTFDAFASGGVTTGSVTVPSGDTLTLASGSTFVLAGPTVNVTDNTTVTVSNTKTLTIAGSGTGAVVISAPFTASNAVVNLAVASGGSVTIGGGATASTLKFLEPSAGGTSYVGFKSPALAATTVYTLPVAFPPVSGYILSSDTSGVESWIAPPSGMTVGGAVIGGTINQVLFVDSSGNLAGAANLLWGATANTLEIAGAIIVTGGATATLIGSDGLSGVASFVGDNPANGGRTGYFFGGAIGGYLKDTASGRELTLCDTNGSIKASEWTAGRPLVVDGSGYAVTSVTPAADGTYANPTSITIAKGLITAIS